MLLTADTSVSADQQTVRLGAQGGLIFIDGRLFRSRYLQDSFALVEVKDYPDVGVGFQGGALTRTDARGQVTDYEYDALGRATRIGYSQGVASRFEYDGGPNPPDANSVGRLSQLTDESGTTRWTHDGLGRVLSKTQVAAGTGRRFVLEANVAQTGSSAPTSVRRTVTIVDSDLPPTVSGSRPSTPARPLPQDQ